MHRSTFEGVFRSQAHAELCVCCRARTSSRCQACHRPVCATDRIALRCCGVRCQTCNKRVPRSVECCAEVEAEPRRGVGPVATTACAGAGVAALVAIGGPLAGIVLVPAFCVVVSWALVSTIPS